jgi:hypothetical protein
VIGLEKVGGSGLEEGLVGGTGNVCVDAVRIDEGNIEVSRQLDYFEGYY